MSADGKDSGPPAAGGGGVSHDSHKIAKSRMRAAQKAMSPGQRGRVMQALSEATGEHRDRISFHALGGLNTWRQPTDPRDSAHAESPEEQVAFHGRPSATRPEMYTPRSEHLQRADTALTGGDMDAFTDHLVKAAETHKVTKGADWPAEPRAAAAASTSAPSEAALKLAGGGKGPVLEADGTASSAALPGLDGAPAEPLTPSGRPNAAALSGVDGSSAPALRAQRAGGSDDGAGASRQSPGRRQSPSSSSGAVAGNTPRASSPVRGSGGSSSSGGVKSASKPPIG